MFLQEIKEKAMKTINLSIDVFTDEELEKRKDDLELGMCVVKEITEILSSDVYDFSDRTQIQIELLKRLSDKGQLNSITFYGVVNELNYIVTQVGLKTVLETLKGKNNENNQSQTQSL